MPIMDAESGFTTQNSDLVRDTVLEYFRKIPRVISNGFKKVIVAELNRLPDSQERSEIVEHLKICSDEYIVGNFHGDLGFANMLVSDKVYLIDFTHSPLIDVVMMGLSLDSEFTQKWHVDLYNDVAKIFKNYRTQLDIIKRVKQLGFK